jgi:nucleoid-associated protein YgaU
MRYFYKGRHRKPTHTAKKIATVTSATAIVFGSTSLLAREASADPPNGWGPIIQCESSGQNIENGGDPGGVSSASGFFQFLDSTWIGFGGGEFAPRAIEATLEEQTIVANRAFVANGLSDWEASRSCWQGKVGSVPTNSQNAPKRTADKLGQSTPKSTVHIVQPGDTLSGIAGVNWPQVYEANKGVIGSNPDLIFPGQSLTV